MQAGVSGRPLRSMRAHAWMCMPACTRCLELLGWRRIARHIRTAASCVASLCSPFIQHRGKETIPCNKCCKPRMARSCRRQAGVARAHAPAVWQRTWKFIEPAAKELVNTVSGAAGSVSARKRLIAMCAKAKPSNTSEGSVFFGFRLTSRCKPCISSSCMRLLGTARRRAFPPRQRGCQRRQLPLQVPMHTRGQPKLWIACA